jgi:hypothetical protein
VVSSARMAARLEMMHAAACLHEVTRPAQAVARAAPAIRAWWVLLLRPWQPPCRHSPPAECWECRGRAQRSNLGHCASSVAEPHAHLPTRISPLLSHTQHTGVTQAACCARSTRIAARTQTPHRRSRAPPRTGGAAGGQRKPCAAPPPTPPGCPRPACSQAPPTSRCLCWRRGVKSRAWASHAKQRTMRVKTQCRTQC